jgi:hypothetical protein
VSIFKEVKSNTKCLFNEVLLISKYFILALSKIIQFVFRSAEKFLPILSHQFLTTPFLPELQELSAIKMYIAVSRSMHTAEIRPLHKSKIGFLETFFASAAHKNRQ